MSIDMETVKLLINVATFSMTKKIELLENKIQTKLEEQESKYKIEIGRLETQNKTLFKMVETLTENKTCNEMMCEDKYKNILANKVYQQDEIINDIIKTQQNVIDKTIYYDNAINIIGNQTFNIPNKYNTIECIYTGLSCKINSKAIDFYKFIEEYGNPHCYSEYKEQQKYEVNNHFGIRGYSNFVLPKFIMSLNVFYNLRTFMFYPRHTCHGKLHINGFTNDNMSIREHHFYYNLTPLYTVETLYIPLTSFYFWNSHLHKETYTNFFKNIFPNLKTIYISVCNYKSEVHQSVNNGCPQFNYQNYIKGAFINSSIEYGLNYMIEHTNIEKIVFTSYRNDSSTFDIPQLPNDICDYLSNIVSNNTTRQIILEIKHKITTEEFKKQNC
jgi:hypothetical protein